MTLYAIKHIPTQCYYGSLPEKHPVLTRYGLYSEEVANKRIKNMNHPEEWEVVVSPRQSSWPD